MKTQQHIGDIVQTPKKPEKPREGAPDGKIGIYDRHGRYRGFVGPKATAVSASRFGARNAVLGKGPDGRPAWLGQKTAAEVSAAATVNTISAKGTNPQIKPPALGGGK